MNTQKTYIVQRRKALGARCSADIIEMNAPFEIKPKNFDGKKGVLLIHGFLTSPYIMRSIGECYAKQGYLVRAVLLTGHGTAPQDLLKPRLKDWQQTVDAGIQTLQADCDQVHLCGFSLGAALAYLASTQYTVASLCLLAPAFAIAGSAQALPLLIALGKLCPLPAFKWLNRIPENNVTSYNRFPPIAAWQVAQAVKQTQKLYQRRGNTLPTFFAASTDDTIVKFSAIETAFNQCSHQQKQLIIFSKGPIEPSPFNNVKLIDSTAPQDNILELSHIGLPVASSDSYLGRDGTYYLDPRLRGDDKHVGEDDNRMSKDDKDASLRAACPTKLQRSGKRSNPEYYYGEILNGHEKAYPHFRRLTYNPHFDVLAKELKTFLSGL